MKTYLNVAGKAVVDDSLRVNGPSKFAGTIMFGAETQSSAGHTQFGTGSFGLGDSAVFAAGGRIADTAAFATTDTRLGIKISGATASDAYFITARRLQEVSTVASTDTSIFSYMAKTDSVIVFRTHGGVSGAKFSWFRVKLR